MIINLAGLVMEVKLRYKYTYDLCKNYLYDGDEKPVFTVFATNEELQTENEKTPGFSPEVLESTCVYRNICRELLKYDAILIHSAAISVDNEAYLFTANSGTGKTTHMNLWIDKFKDRAFIINGDKPILRKTDEGIFVYGTPWCGKEGFNKNVKVKLKGICILERSEENIIKKTDKKEALTFLISQTSRPTDINNTDLMLKNLENIVENTPVYRLGCNMDMEACEICYKEMNKKQKERKPMSIAKIKSAGLSGIDGYIVDVQTDISNGLPAFEIVGLPDAAVREAKERIRSSIKNIGASFPGKRVIINLAPAACKKEGSVYDVPMAVSIMCATGQIRCEDIEEYAFMGELALDGGVAPITGVLPMVISLYKAGIKNIFVPYENASEAAVIDGCSIYPVKNIKDVVEHFNSDNKIAKHTVDISNILSAAENAILDFCDVKGQESVKRAIEIAAAGNHNILMIGSPGTGKTMLAQRIGSILPDLSFDEALEVTKIHSIAGELPSNMPLISKRPFRHPHHTISPQGLSGGGAVPRPGELSLAHNGVLFLDELPEFRRDVLEVMRQPLEDGVVTISRVNATLSYPCNLMLVASMNPCKCGYLGDAHRNCTCTENQIARYRSKISGPLLDRIDIQVEVENVNYDDLSSAQKSESSRDIKKRVNNARKIQMERYKNYSIYSNSQLDAGLLQEFCKLGEEENEILKAAFDNLGLSARAHSRILEVARTIADLEQRENITAAHLAEAIQYRSLDRKFFK